jgi:zinc transport system ATP-binding protein
MADANAAVVEMQDVWFAFDGGWTLEAVDFRVEQGEFWAVLGPNGGGKTTLIRIILGLLRPQRGEVRVFGCDPLCCGGRVGYVPQRIEASEHFPVTAEQVAGMGLRNMRSGRRRKLAREALERVEMADLASRRFDDLSGGQRQRVLVARALACGPELLVFDEPTSSIDPQGKVCLHELIVSLAEQITVLVVSHDPVMAHGAVDGIAAVNRRLMAERGSRLSQEMLSLIYGSHRHPCPIESYLQGAVS